MVLNIFSNNDLWIKSLASLCARLKVQFGIIISPQSLNEQFNDDFVKILQDLFSTMLMNENNLFNSKNTVLLHFFNRTLVTASTILTLPKDFYKDFRDAGY